MVYKYLFESLTSILLGICPEVESYGNIKKLCDQNVYSCFKLLSYIATENEYSPLKKSLSNTRGTDFISHSLEKIAINGNYI